MSKSSPPVDLGSSEHLSTLVNAVAAEWKMAGLSPETVHGRFAVEVARRAVDALKPMTLALCERHSLVLRIGRPYVFRPIGDCKRCAEMAAQAKEAYGEEDGG